MFLASIAMVFCGWLAEIDIMQKLVGFVISMSCWLYIVYETFAGEAAMYAAKHAGKKHHAKKHAEAKTGEAAPAATPAKTETKTQ